MIKLQLLAFLFLAVSPFALNAQLASFQSVTPDQAINLVEGGALFVDVRENDEVARLAYDVDNVVRIPLSELSARMSELPTDRKLIVACQAGGRSGKAIVALQRAGYTDLVNLEGGMQNWFSLDLPVLTADQQAAGGATSAPKKACCAGKAKSCAKGSR